MSATTDQTATNAQRERSEHNPISTNNRMSYDETATLHSISPTRPCSDWLAYRSNTTDLTRDANAAVTLATANIERLQGFTSIRDLDRSDHR